MYEKIYAKLSSYKTYFIAKIGRNCTICKELNNEIKEKSTSELEYHFFLTRLYFVNFYHAILCHETWLKQTKSIPSPNETETKTAHNETVNRETKKTHPEVDNTASRSLVASSNDSEYQLNAQLEPKDQEHESSTKNTLENSESKKSQSKQDLVHKQTQDAECPENEIHSCDYLHEEMHGQDKLNFQKKLFKFLVIKTHPDKTRKKTTQLFIETKIVNQSGYLSILFLLAVAFGYKKKLSKKEIELLQYNTAEIIEITESLYRACSNFE